MDNKYKFGDGLTKKQAIELIRNAKTAEDALDALLANGFDAPIYKQTFDAGVWYGLNFKPDIERE